MSVVLGAPSEAARDADTLGLLRYGLAQYRRARPVRAGATLSTASVEYFGGREVRLVPARTGVRHCAARPAVAHRGAGPGAGHGSCCRPAPGSAR